MHRICKQALIKLHRSMQNIPTMFKCIRPRTLAISTVLFLILLFFGVFTHLLEQDFDTSFHYPYDGNIESLVQQLRGAKEPDVAPINKYKFDFVRNCSAKCRNVEALRLVYLIKSAPDHFERRQAIRNSWGFERRFSDVEIRTVFLLGTRKDASLRELIRQESQEHSDIIQAKFNDNYFNNTLKTMMGFTWVNEFCSNARFYMFVDDDYYVSTKNVLRFVRNPTKYPEYLQVKYKTSRTLRQFDIDLDEKVRLYSGFVFNSSPHRHFSSPWYVSLQEYPYHKWPPYVTAGAYIVSREAVLDMYYASFYTKHFRFDDIYVAILAYKCKIEPFHSDRFHFYKANYNPKLYEFLIASHGYSDSQELLNVWTKEKSLGHA